jgi:hypothetical protein
MILHSAQHRLGALSLNTDCCEENTVRAGKRKIGSLSRDEVLRGELSSVVALVWAFLPSARRDAAISVCFLDDRKVARVKRLSRVIETWSRQWSIMNRGVTDAGEHR